MSGPTWLPPKHFTTVEQAPTSVSVSAPAVFRPQKKFATIPVPKSSRCEQNGSLALGTPPLYQTSSTGGFAIAPLPDGSESHASNSGAFLPNTIEHFHSAAQFSSEGRILSAWGPGSPSYQMQGVSHERGGYHPSNIDAEIDSLTSMLAELESSKPRRQVELPAYDAMPHSSSAQSAAFNSKLSTGYKPKQAAYGAVPYAGSYGAEQKTLGYGASPQCAPYKNSSMTGSAYNPVLLESNATGQSGGYLVSQSSQNLKSYPQPMPASYTTASSSAGPALNVQVKVAQPVLNYTEPRRKAEQAYGPPSPRCLGPSNPPLYSTVPSEPSYRAKIVSEQSYRGPQPMEQLYKGHQTTESLYRVQTNQSSEQSYRVPQTEPTYREPQATEASYRIQIAEQPYRGPPIIEPSYRGSQLSELSYRGHPIGEISYRSPPTNEQPYRAPQATETSYRDPHVIESTYRGPHIAEQSFRGSQTRGLQGTDCSYRAPQSSETSYKGLQNTDPTYRAPQHNSNLSNRAQQNRYPDLKTGPNQNWYQTSTYSSGNDSGYNDAEMSQDRQYGQFVKKIDADMSSAGTKTMVQQQQVSVGRVNREQSTQPSGASASQPQQGTSSRPEEELDRLTKKLVHDMNHPPVGEYFGRCARCGENVVGDGTGCIAMDQVFHEDCFTCISCHCRLRGQPFYAIEKKSYCEACYIVTLEKCSMCEKPILDRILRAMGQAYHPQCFICVVCRRCLDGVPFTVDATSQIHCIDDFHRKFAPRCSVCGNAIMPEPGQEETVRIVALDRSFHINCYKCEECGLVLSSEGEGRGCYPLDGHILCKSCSARRIQELSAKITTDC